MFLKILPFLSILFFRFIGLFIVLPVISLLVYTIPHATLWNVGLVVGAPYLLQMLFQPIFGRLSDKYGRKPLLIIGLIIFLIGSIICMFETSIYYLILGRCVQGIGAIGGLLTALVADSVHEEKRTGAMALMGVGIFASFIVSMILGSILGAYYGLNSLFALSAFVTLLSIIIALFCIKPTPKTTYIYPKHQEDEKLRKEIQKSILTISISGFIEKFLMVLTFALTPIILHEHISTTSFWTIYLPAVIVAIFALAPTSIISEKRGKSKEVLLVSILLFCFAYVCMVLWLDNLILFGVAVALFFTAFSMQEALLQSLISKYAKAQSRGRVIGDFTAAGFGGSFAGAMLGGFLTKYSMILQYRYILFGGLIVCIILWFFLVIRTIRNPHITKTLYLPMQEVHLKDIEQLSTLKGIIEWYENKQESVLTIKYNTKNLSSTQIYDFLHIQANKEK